MIDNEMVRQIYARAQRKFFVKNLAMALANREPGDALKVQGGRKYHKPIIGFAQMQAYTPLTATSSSQNVSTTDESLTVDRATHAESIHINIDDTEKAQLKDQDLVSVYGDDLGAAMRDSVEKRWVSNITSIHTIGSTASPVDFSGANILDVVEDGLGLVDVADVDDIQRVILMGPRAYRAVEKATANRETSLGDATYLNGYAARPLMDSMIVWSNNLPWSATLTLSAANPSAGDTVTIAGATFTFRAVPALPGEVDIGADATGSAANLLAAITGGAGAGTAYIPVSSMQQMYLQRNRRIAGVNTAGVIAFTGFGDIGVASTMTNASNRWSAQVSKMFFTAVGATDLALQLDGGLEMSRPKPMTGEAHFSRISGVILHNSKTFTDGQYMTVVTNLDASNY
jgi:hypothetical protein